MNRYVTLTAGACAFAIAVLLHWPAGASPTAPNPDVQRGRYLVEGLAGCGDCHTPRDGRGAPRLDRRLMGAAIDFVPRHPMPAWADRSPSLAGLPAGYTEAQLATFLETGRKPAGGAARPPMPAFRMTVADAKAVAAYLKSLRPDRPPAARNLPGA